MSYMFFINSIAASQAALCTSGLNAALSVALSGAGQASARLVDQRQRKASGATRALLHYKLATHTLGETAVDACLVTLCHHEHSESERVKTRGSYRYVPLHVESAVRVANFAFRA